MAISTESRFFGLDLNQLKADVLATWRKAPQWPPLSWLRPAQALALWPAQGEPHLVWENGQAAAIKRRPAFWAIELPESMVLRKTLQLPALEPRDCASAAQLEAQSISPFPAADLLWGYVQTQRSSTAVQLQLVLASRVQVLPYVQEKTQQRQASLGAPNGAKAQKADVPAEVWVFGPQRQPIVMHGFGEAQRIRDGQQKLWRNSAGVLLAALLLAGIALTPTAQIRLRAIEAVHAHEAIEAQTKDVVLQRERLMQNADQVATLSGLLAERIDAVKVLSMLTRVLPDDTALQSARIQGSKVTITGVTENASALMQKLSEQEGIKDVKAPSAATRMGALNKESFTIELMLDTKTFGPTIKLDEPPAPATPATSSTDAASAALAGAAEGTPTSAASAPATNTPAPSAEPKAQDAQRGGPVFGGSKSGPVLGGSKPRPAPGGQP